MDTEETISLIDSLSNVNNYPDPRSVNVVQSHTDSENVQTETGDRETINNVDEKVDNSLVTELAPSSNFTIKDCSNGLPQSDEGDREMVPIKCDELDGADTADKSFQDTNKQGDTTTTEKANLEVVQVPKSNEQDHNDGYEMKTNTGQKPVGTEPKFQSRSLFAAVSTEDEDEKPFDINNSEVRVEENESVASSNRATPTSEVIFEESHNRVTPTFVVIGEESSSRVTPTSEVIGEVSSNRDTPISKVIDEESSNRVTPTSEVIGDESSSMVTPASEVIGKESSNRVTPTSEVIGEESSNRVTPTSEVIGEESSNRVTPTSEVIGEESSNRVTPTSEVIGEESSNRVTPTSECIVDNPSNRATPIHEVLENSVDVSSHGSILETDEKQIYDETVSSTDNLNEEKPCSISKQNENIFDKLTGHFKNTEEQLDMRDSSSNFQNSLYGLNMNQNDVERGSQIATDSEREAAEDDIMNFSISQDESEVETPAVADDTGRNELILSVKPNSNETNRNKEIEPDSQVSNDTIKEVPVVNFDNQNPADSHDSPAEQYNYLQKMSNVIKAIDSSKSTTAQKKDRDNIFSVFSAEISQEPSSSLPSQKRSETADGRQNIENEYNCINESTTSVDDESAIHDKADLTSQTSNSNPNSESISMIISNENSQSEQDFIDTNNARNDYDDYHLNTGSRETASESISDRASEEPVEVSLPTSGRSFVQAIVPEVTGPPLTVKVKREQDTEESGDILDILNTTTSTVPVTSGINVESTNEPISAVTNSSSSTVSVSGTLFPSAGITIKEEPQDDFNTGPSDVPPSNSLEHLSRQVNNLHRPKSSNVAKKSTTSRPPSQGKKPSSQVSVPVNVMPRPAAPNTIQQRQNMTTRYQITSSATNLTQIHPISQVQLVRPTMNRPITVNNMKTVTIVSNGRTLTVPVSSVISVSKPSSQTEGAKLTTQTAIKPTTQTPLPKSTINIDTVGLNAITELIARKNPIPNYKPPPIPDNLKSVIAEDKCKHICFECGDTFLFESSLKVHRSRTSMLLKYKCEECKGEKVFFNKCQFLGHLRNHLKIDKSQAVPIHIKSDSISITTLDHGPNVNHWLKWIDDIETKPESLPRKSQEDIKKMSDKNTAKSNECIEVTGKAGNELKSSENKIVRKEEGFHRCHECGGVYTDLKNHFGYYSNEGNRYSCNSCKKMLPSMCSGRAHRRIHEDKEPYVCPECGKSFSSLYVDEKKMPDQKESFAYHVFYECFHTCRALKTNCPKCDLVICNSFTDYQAHLGLALEQYYKCQVCPMAFKQPNSFLKHFVTHNDYKSCKKSFKVIYRCHVCDSVMDNKTVLEMHIMKHVTEARNRTHYEYMCRLCKNWISGRLQMKKHMEEKHESVVKNPNADLKEMYQCTECSKMFSKLFDLLRHEILNHTHKKPAGHILSVKCRTCGILLFNKQNNGKQSKHFCINPDPNKVPYTSVSLDPNQKHVDVDTVEKSIACALCSKVVATKRLLQSHLINHKMQGELICQYCQDTSFTTVEEVQSHQDECQERPSGRKKGNCKPGLPMIEYPCDVCGFICFNKIDLAKHHKENHTETGIHPCHLCSSTYESQEMLRKHIMATHEGKRILLHCHICQKRGIKKAFSSKDRFEKHLSMRHKNSKNRTVVDNDSDAKMTPSPEAVKRKLSESDDSAPMKRLRVHGEAQFTCAKCPFSCNDKTNFGAHLVEHKIENCVQCLECGLSFAVMPTLRKHLFMVHKIKDFDNYCKENAIDELPEAKMDDSEIRKGLLSDSEQEKESSEQEMESSNPLECRVCYKVFDTEAAVRSHLRTHGMAFIRNRRFKPKERGGNQDKSQDASVIS